MHRIPGDTLAPMGELSTSDVHTITAQLAETMRLAHDVASPLETADIPIRHLAPTIEEYMEYNYAFLVSQGCEPSDESLRQWKTPFHFAYAPDSADVFLHGDLWTENVMQFNNSTPVVIDTCGYVGLREFDAARWIARVRPLSLFEELTELWLDLDRRMTRERLYAALSLECLRDADIVELLKVRNHDYTEAQSAAVRDGLLEMASEYLSASGLGHSRAS
jgi:hypothetical protein